MTAAAPCIAAGAASDGLPAPAVRETVDSMIARLIQRTYNGFLGLFSSRRPFVDTSGLPWVAEVERQWREIRRELESVLQGQSIPAFDQISEQQIPLCGDNRWHTFFFHIYGREVPENCALCPQTAAALRRIPGMSTSMFSILSPGKHIPAHRGPFRGVLRYHLALVVPQDAAACRIRVGDEVRHWAEGQSLLFDDTFDHEVWNDTDQRRVVLFVDVLRPLPWPVSWLNRLMVAAIGRLYPEVRIGVERARQFAHDKGPDLAGAART